jgi:dTDP-L-rhamnose 4-epimerase
MGKSKVLITGGLGFIGQATAKILISNGYRVDLLDNLSVQIHGPIPHFDLGVLDSPDVSVHRGDIRDSRMMGPLLAEADYVVHLAAETGTAQSMYEIAHYNEINSQGTAILLDWMANNKHQIKKVILSSSRSVYGEGAYRCRCCGLITPNSRTSERLDSKCWDPICPSCGREIELVATPESSLPNPASIYAATKLAQEDLVRIACCSLGVPYTILRFQNVYGPGQSLNNPYTGILSIFSTRVRRGLHLPIFEDGLESRDFIHVTDIARAIHLCIESPASDGKVLNAGSGIPVPVIRVAEMLVSSLGGHSKIEITGQYRLGDIRHCYADISTIQGTTAFSPSVNLEEGLSGFADWVLTQPLPEDGLDKANKLLLDRGLMK